jgi:hypothetical protein
MKKLLIALILFLTVLSSYSQTQNTYPTIPVKPKGNYFLHTGFSFDAVLDTAIFSQGIG